MKLIYNTELRTADLIDDNAKVPTGWTDKKPLWVRYEEWDGTNWINLDEDGFLAEKDEEDRKIKSELNQLDLKSIRDIRLWISKQSDSSKFLKDLEKEAVEKRKKLK